MGAIDNSIKSVGWFSQLNTMLKKNFLLHFRNQRSLCLTFTVPLFMVLFIYILSLSVDRNEIYKDFVSDIKTPIPEDIGPIPLCQPRGSCTTLAYVNEGGLNGAIVDQLMIDIGAEIGLPDVANNDLIVEYATPEDFDDFVNFQKRNNTQGAYLWTINDLGGGDYEVGYTLQYNQTGYSHQGKFISTSTFVAAPMQVAADKHLLRLVSGDPSLTFRVSSNDIPHPPLILIDIWGTDGWEMVIGNMMFLFVVQISDIVVEKEEKLRLAMNMLGLRDSVYWISWFVPNLLQNLISMAILVGAGRLSAPPFFVQNDWQIYVIHFTTFAFSMVPLVFLISSLVSKSKSANAVGFLIYFISFFFGGFALFIFQDAFKERFPFWYYLIRLFNFSLLSGGMYEMYLATDDGNGLRWEDYDTDSKMFEFALWMIIDFFIYFILAYVIDKVKADQFGVRKWGNDKKQGNVTDVETILDEKTMSKAVIKEIKSVEKRSVEKIDLENDVLVQGLVKTYDANTKHPVKAVRGLYLHMVGGEIFCLLGHNGAGKSQTLSMLTGIIKPTSGLATINGKNVWTEMDSIRKDLGVCPQHDILWNRLTGADHIRLFARMRGIKDTDKEITDRLTEVSLMDTKSKRISEFSGGMRRRLSVALSLIGSPKVIFLDEPTTGMDPVSRREIWNLINNLRGTGKVVLLTTHSMEEADVLSDKIAIIAHGQLKTVGTSLSLKSEFGSGYSVIFHYSLKDSFKDDDLSSTLTSGVGSGFTIDSERQAVIAKFGPDESTQLASYLTFLDNESSLSKIINIEDIQLLNPSMNEVFMKVAAAEEKKWNEEMKARKKAAKSGKKKSKKTQKST